MADTDIKKYKHKYQLRVRNFQVDSQGIVHNAIYLEYCEIGRVEYARNLGIQMLPTGIFDRRVMLNVKRNEIDYESAAMVDDLLDIYTRISYIKNSSFCFEHLIFNAETNKLLVTQKSIQVNLNSNTNKPERLPDHLRKVIIDFEGKDVELIS
ncbi:MAG: acyl-CoA thioesterase [Chlorobi bacterium]|nr:acyl-CoA thioesterase [Chlorobiota bacterium]MCI0715464.1 acyl-CoA thioesterase [Chlorobiota bacterium]